jgi:hypothetical protein
MSFHLIFSKYGLSINLYEFRHIGISPIAVREGTDGSVWLLQNTRKRDEKKAKSLHDIRGKKVS